MPFFNDSDELGTVVKELWVTIADDSKISSPLLDSKLIVRFHYKEPDGQITIDCSDGENMVIEWRDCVKQPVVEMFMQADSFAVTVANTNELAPSRKKPPP